LPSDLKIKRDECNNFSDKLLEKEKTAKSEADYQLLTEDYKLLKEMIINYTQECNNRGIKKNNDNLIKDIEEKILRFERQSGNSLSNSNEEILNLCSICGKEFNHNGYEEISYGVWELCKDPYQGQICSKSCGIKHTRNSDKIYNTNSKNDYEMGNDGRVYETKACGLCNGTGIESGRDPMTGEKTGRICPMCDGRGRQSY
jgi:hypothetical protein